jgi:1,4-dihydroxy-6-naphthoate synthase
MNKQLSIGFSPCPNDCFVFDAMIHGKIDTEGLVFDPVIKDVEDLNRKAFDGVLDITKLSFHAFAYLTEQYILLDAGSALGKGCGPLLISRSVLNDPHWEDMKIGIPGKYTTAALLFGLAFPKAKNKVELVFSEIEDSILSGKIDAGVIIHENRFTYEQKGLKKILDLGEFWEQTTHALIPLGGIVAKRNLGDSLRKKINRVLKKSIQFAFEHQDSSLPFIKENAQELNDEVIYKHINLYVNKYTVSLGVSGRFAVDQLFNRIKKENLLKINNDVIFS